MSSPENENLSDVPVEIVLSEEDFIKFIETIENPPAPSAKLIEAMRGCRLRIELDTNDSEK